MIGASCYQQPAQHGVFGDLLKHHVLLKVAGTKGIFEPSHQVKGAAQPLLVARLAIIRQPLIYDAPGVADAFAFQDKPVLREQMADHCRPAQAGLAARAGNLHLAFDLTEAIGKKIRILQQFVQSIEPAPTPAEAADLQISVQEIFDIFGRSKRGDDVGKRGRLNLGGEAAADKKRGATMAFRPIRRNLPASRSRAPGPGKPPIRSRQKDARATAARGKRE